MVKIAITGSEKLLVQADNSYQISVAFDILDEAGEKLAERVLGFPFGITPAEVKNELIKFARTYEDDRQRSVANADFEAQQAQADEVIASVDGLEISSDEELAEPLDQAQPEVEGEQNLVG